MLAAQKHLELRPGHDGLDPAQPFPRIFLEIPHADVEGRAAPDLHGIEATVVERRTQRQQVVGRDPCGQLALLAVTRREIGDLHPAAAGWLRQQLVHVFG